MYDRVITNTLKELSGEVGKESRKNQTKRRAACNSASVLRSEHVLARDDCAIFSAIFSRVQAPARLAELDCSIIPRCMRVRSYRNFISINEREGDAIQREQATSYRARVGWCSWTHYRNFAHEWNIFYVFFLSTFFPDRHETERLIKLERRNKLRA